jgi:hypothetical protein
VKPRAQLLGFTQTVGIVTALLSLPRVGLPRCRAALPPSSLCSLCSTPLLWWSLRVLKRSYKLSKPSGTTCSFRRKLSQLTKLLVRINLHRGYPTITQLVFWSSAERDSTQRTRSRRTNCAKKCAFTFCHYGPVAREFRRHNIQVMYDETENVGRSTINRQKFELTTQCFWCGEIGDQKLRKDSNSVKDLEPIAQSPHLVVDHVETWGVGVPGDYREETTFGRS